MGRVWVAGVCALLLLAHPPALRAQSNPPPFALLDVPYISQSEALCGGAAAAMVLRYWGEQSVSADTFAPLVDTSASGIRTEALIAELQRRGWMAIASSGSGDQVRAGLSRGRPAIALIEDHPSAFHYVVIVGWHDRGVVLHDPARTPFRVMPVNEFERRWSATNHWMAIVLPGTNPGTVADGVSRIVTEPAPTTTANSSCEERVQQGIAFAQANDLAAAERTLSGALECPGTLRELAGVRLLQQRWAEAAELATSVVREDPEDTYSWKLLATSLFVQDQRSGALKAWNRASEPKVDRVQIDGLSRTRHPVVERLIGLEPGSTLTPGRLVRSQRRLADLPSARSTTLDYQPGPMGLAVLRGAVSERRLAPTGLIPLSTLGAMAIATREVRVATGSFTGGGEQVYAAWRYWPQRPRVAAGILAPAPWGGIWSANAYAERQEFASTDLSPSESPSESAGGWLELSKWQTSRIRWTGVVGVDRWVHEPARAHLGGAVRILSLNRRFNVNARVDGWGGSQPFATSEGRVAVRSNPDLRGVVLAAEANLQASSVNTPLALWRGGDTGQARPVLLRAHPILSHGRLRIDRLGRLFGETSVEVQRWWRVAGPIRAAAAGFGDAGRTMRMRIGTDRNDFDMDRNDFDIGIGARLAIAGMQGVFRVDAARGLRDGEHAISFVYEP
jgi:hypothetical protein